MRRLAHWSFVHRRLVVAGWAGVLVITFFIGSTTGSNYSTGSKLTGTESATAQTLLRQAAPSVAGDTEHHGLTIEHEMRLPDLQRRLDDPGKAVSPVVAAPRDQADAVAVTLQPEPVDPMQAQRAERCTS